MINYGSGGIGSEIIANRLGVGPMHDCLDCAYEEFFLTSFTVGDPAMLVDIPANLGLETVRPDARHRPACARHRPEGELRRLPDDPSNVHHSYIGDFVKFRNTHIGKEQHVFHLHNHQWLYNPNDDNSNYLDAQGIGPGVGYTYEINFGGSGNRNKSAGDAIFHCHFYPHFAQGMWYHWRNHDVFEEGTPLLVSGAACHTDPFALKNGMPPGRRPSPSQAGDPRTPHVPAARARALPDGEIVAGTPIPAMVPLPGKAMAPMPGEVDGRREVPTRGGRPQPVGCDAKVVRRGRPTATGRIVTGCDSGDPPAACSDRAQTPRDADPMRHRNPGYPFWLRRRRDARCGQRMPSPPLDMARAGRRLGRRPAAPRAATATPPGRGAPGRLAVAARPVDFTKTILKAAAGLLPRGRHRPREGRDGLPRRAQPPEHGDAPERPAPPPANSSPTARAGRCRARRTTSRASTTGATLLDGRRHRHFFDGQRRRSGTHRRRRLQRRQPAHLQGREHPVRRGPEQGRLPLSPAADHRAVGGRRAGHQQAASRPSRW